MFGTIIIDAYKQKETEELAAAINYLCSPKDCSGWASTGIYSFWDYDTNEILYIGLARDLYERFCQHNGLLKTTKEGCKFQQIQKYFETHEKLGYTIFVQSPLSQPIVHRNKKIYEKLVDEEDPPIQDLISDQGINDTKQVEGILIEAYKKAYGRFPEWNKMGGSTAGQKSVMENNINIVKSFSNPQMYVVNPIISRSTIRELSNNSIYEQFEKYLHSVRMYVLFMGMDFTKALQLQNNYDCFGWYKRICDDGYLDKKLIV